MESRQKAFIYKNLENEIIDNYGKWQYASLKNKLGVSSFKELVDTYQRIKNPEARIFTLQEKLILDRAVDMVKNYRNHQH